ncbi:MAG: hypothetical protein L0H25_05115 [Micrococcales bacterium]|nr:hypothetical protein [Micrococcales bacterium]
MTLLLGSGGIGAGPQLAVMEAAMPPSTTGVNRPPGTSKVAMSLSLVRQVVEVHRSTAPASQPTNGTMIPPMSSRTIAVRSQ